MSQPKRVKLEPLDEHEPHSGRSEDVRGLSASTSISRPAEAENEGQGPSAPVPNIFQLPLGRNERRRDLEARRHEDAIRVKLEATESQPVSSSSAQQTPVHAPSAHHQPQLSANTASVHSKPIPPVAPANAPVSAPNMEIDNPHPAGHNGENHQHRSAAPSEKSLPRVSEPRSSIRHDISHRGTYDGDSKSQSVSVARKDQGYRPSSERRHSHNVKPQAPEQKRHCSPKSDNSREILLAYETTTRATPWAASSEDLLDRLEQVHRLDENDRPNSRADNFDKSSHDRKRRRDSDSISEEDTPSINNSSKLIFVPGDVNLNIPKLFVPLCATFRECQKLASSGEIHLSDLVEYLVAEYDHYLLQADYTCDEEGVRAYIEHAGNAGLEFAYGKDEDEKVIIWQLMPDVKKLLKVPKIEASDSLITEGNVNVTLEVVKVLIANQSPPTIKMAAPSKMTLQVLAQNLRQKAGLALDHHRLRARLRTMCSGGLPLEVVDNEVSIVRLTRPQRVKMLAHVFDELRKIYSGSLLARHHQVKAYMDVNPGAYLILPSLDIREIALEAERLRATGVKWHGGGGGGYITWP